MHWQPVIRLNDYEMYCCMVDENATQQRMTPKLVFENVIAAIRVAEQMLRETRNVHEFNALFKRSRGLPTLLQKSVRPDPDGRNSDWAPEEYTRAKLAIEPSGEVLGKDFLRHFLPKHSVASNSPCKRLLPGFMKNGGGRKGID